MSWLLLALGVVSLVFALNAFLPVRRNIWLFFPSFVASWLAIELAWLYLLVWVGLTSLLVWAGALDHWPGWVGLALSVAAWVALVITILWSRSASAAAEAVLAEVGVSDGPGPRLRLDRTRDITYARVAGRTLKLDVFGLRCRRGRGPAARPCSRSTAAPGSSATSASRASRC